MLDKDKRIMEACGNLLPRLSEAEKERFLTFTEGMAFISSRPIYTTDAAPQVQK